MIEEIFAGLLILHGLIHLIGVVQEFTDIELEDFSGETLINMSESSHKIGGVFWGITTILFLISTYAFLTDTPWWIYITVLSAILSQILVILWWPDAKFGTIANILVIVGTIYWN
jgi:hypothetical protein